jgi:hypothetical protein
MSDLIERLENPPFGTETSERNLMAAAAAALRSAAAREAALVAALGAIDREISHGLDNYKGPVELKIARAVRTIARAALAAAKGDAP